uniref:VOC domain-containing protein n=1 Tax=Arion vulgaris TaxID=1028688 RepID=A0A0B6YZJ3_9EUPU
MQRSSCIILRHLSHHLSSKSLAVTWSASRQFREFHYSKYCCKQNKLWNLGKINHIALVTADLDKSASLYKDVLGGQVSRKKPLPEHGVTTVFVELGDTKIELLHPLGDNSPIKSFLEKNKAGGQYP